jgi:hypothetical protein
MLEQCSKYLQADQIADTLRLRYIGMLDTQIVQGRELAEEQIFFLLNNIQCDLSFIAIPRLLSVPPENSLVFLSFLGVVCCYSLKKYDKGNRSYRRLKILFKERQTWLLLSALM